TITGYEEELRLSVYDLGSGRVQEIGQGSHPQWSGSGAYLSYWRDDGYLYVNLDGTIAGSIEASSPEVRWNGDDLYFWYADEIRLWHEGVARTIAHVDPDLIPRYPRDDSYFSADATGFTVTRYSLDGTTERYVGVTATGGMTKLDDPDTTFTEWAPHGETLLVRSNDKLALIDAIGEQSAPLSTFTGTVHGWTADGHLLVGMVSATVPGGNVFDRIPVWDPTDEGDKRIATLPNLFGTRSFSPDGRWFSGVSRTGLYETQLELYRCGVASGQGVDLRADPAARSRLTRIEDASRRFVRPVSGASRAKRLSRCARVRRIRPFSLPCTPRVASSRRSSSDSCSAQRCHRRSKTIRAHRLPHRAGRPLERSAGSVPCADGPDEGY